MNPFNIVQFLPEMARAAPDRAAVICEHAPDEQGRTHLTFAQLDAESDALAWGLTVHGIKPGHRTLLAVRPGLDFIALTFALFKIGAVPVLIDPGMGRKNLLNCVNRARPQAVIAVALAHILLGKLPDSVKTKFLIGRSWLNWLCAGPRVKKFKRDGAKQGSFPVAATHPDSLAAILFTSGGTGIPKGVCYEHGMFGAQVELIREHFQIQPGEIDLPAFPLFALFSTALGVTSVIPDMNPSRPAQCDPDKIIDAITRHRVTYSFGSPAIWKRVGPRCIERRVTLPSLKRILMAGAPVRGEVLAPFAKILAPGADVFIPYGATEALPVCSIRGSDVLNETWALTRQGRGYCVGKPLLGMAVKIIGERETNGGRSAAAPELARGEIGEIVVKGPVVTKEYFEMPDETAKSKIGDPTSGDFWHRMGDMGYEDEAGRIWFCGRKAHRVTAQNGRAYYSVCCEAIFEEFLRTKLSLETRAALVGIGAPDAKRPALVVELTGQIRARGVQTKISEAWKKEPLSADIALLFFYKKQFPVDVRHNAKIDREYLSKWAASAR
ncbi:MAG TPA: fatty acid CoA ligase family protein [Planctomycetota bacterium]|nr:fatty acid CoA ligase family protein [Planctomycetota bacterium]